MNRLLERKVVIAADAVNMALLVLLGDELSDTLGIAYPLAAIAGLGATNAFGSQTAQNRVEVGLSVKMAVALRPILL